MNIESRYFIVEELSKDEPQHLRARNRVTGEMVSLFLYRRHELEWERLWNRYSVLPVRSRGTLIEQFRSDDGQVVITPSLTAATSLREYLLSPPPVAGISTSTGSDWQRVRERFLAPQNLATPPAPRRDLQAVPSLNVALAAAGVGAGPALSLPAAPALPAPKPKLTLASVPSELEIFEARTVRVDLESSLSRAIAPPQTLQSTTMDLRALMSAVPDVRPQSDWKSSVGLYALYATGVVALAAAVAAFLMR